MTLSETAAFVVRHPVRSALRVVGAAKGIVEVVTGRTPATPEVVPQQRVPEREPLPAAEQRPPAAPHESFTTEPSGFEDWHDEVAVEAAEVDEPTPDPWQQPETEEPLLDPSVTKQVKAGLDRGLRDAQP